MTDFDALLVHLKSGNADLGKKREVVKSIHTTLKSNPTDSDRKSCIDILNLLVEDSDHDVRTEVAENLLYLPEDDYRPLISRLLRDSYKYVRIAAEKTHTRRGKILRTEFFKSQPANDILGIYNELLPYGADVADKVLDIALKYYDAMFSTTIHELKAVDARIKNSVDFIEGRLEKKGALDSYITNRLSRIVDATDHYLKILNDLVTLKSELKTECRYESLNEILEEAIALVDEKLGRDHPEYSCDLKYNEDDVMVYVSRHQMIQVFRNIIKNACEAQKYTGKLKITKWEDKAKQRVAISIEDHGRGMSQKELDTIFLPGKTSKRSSGGTGFGLPIALRLAKANHCDINVQSTKDTGTTFTISVPMRLADE